MNLCWKFGLVEPRLAGKETQLRFKLSKTEAGN
jgi:hypothetical protein